MTKIFHQKGPGMIQECHDEAVCVHYLEAAGSSFFQIAMQLFFMLLLVALGTGTVIDGVDVVDFFKSVGE